MVKHGPALDLRKKAQCLFVLIGGGTSVDGVIHQLAECSHLNYFDLQGEMDLSTTMLYP